jgi:imidazolonepropionase-like amidohydrolase
LYKSRSSGRLCRNFLILALLLPFASCAPRREPSIAIAHVTVIDMVSANALPDQTVVIEKQRIKLLGPANSVSIPYGAQVVDATGKFLIPGLADMHVHLTAAGEPDGSRKFMLPLLLANGITSVRDMGGYLESIRPLQRDIAEGKRLGPSIVTPGPYLDGSPPSFQPSFVVSNAVQGTEDVHQLIARRVDFIKVQSVLSREAYFAIAQAANREHIRFVGHVPDRVTAAEAADAGQHSIEHLTNVLRGCSRDEPKLMREQFFITAKKQTPVQTHAREYRWLQELLDHFSDEKASALLAKFKEKDVWQTPTLVLLKNDAFPTLENSAVSDERRKSVPAAILVAWKKSRAEQMQGIGAPQSMLRAALLQKSMQLVGEMQKSGVRILAGTDAPAPYLFPGSSLHDELELLVDAGLTPREALRTATLSAAEFLRTEKDLGSIEKGKYADLVLLDADPLENIRNTRKISLLVLRGKLLDRAALDALLQSEQGFAAN